jgi:lipoyl(octanoyl) transferase
MSAVLLRDCGLSAYEPMWRAMQSFTDARTAETADEIWFAEHPPVFTLGLNASPEHVLDAGGIPVVRIDRGGQVTYHGPGQLLVYPLLDLRRLRLGVSDLVAALEASIVAYAAGLGIEAVAQLDARGVYVDGAKLASIGLRIRRGASYHGLALNVNLDLAPFRRINVCGHRGLAVTRLADLCGVGGVADVVPALTPHLLRALGLQGHAAEGDHSAISTSLQAVNSR